jgi:Domain of unknown function (DUF1929)
MSLHRLQIIASLFFSCALLAKSSNVLAHGPAGHSPETKPTVSIMDGSWTLFPTQIAAAGTIDPTGESHQAVDWVAIDPEAERLMYEKVKREGIGYDKTQFKSPSSASSAKIRPNADLAGVDPGKLGKWDGPYDWPVVAAHATLMPNGNVLAYDSVGNAPTESYEQHTFTRATVWNPASNSHVGVNSTTGFNIFCSGVTILNDGRIFMAGGNLNSALDGIDKTHIFNPSNNTWQIEGTMQAARWYPSVTTLFNQEVLISGGGPTTPEIRATNGGLRALGGANADIAANRSVYHWLKQAPDGRVVYLGPDPTLRYLNTSGAGSWASFTQRDGLSRTYGSHAMYAIGKVLISGGGPRNATALVVDLNNGSVSPTSSMNAQRIQHNLTVLPNGKVLATGGLQNSDRDLVDVNNGVFPAEHWNPADGKWTSLARMKVTRQYHSIAMLLPDGRVLSAGGGICGACQTQNYLAKNAEIFSPPYLFKQDGSGQLASRPNIGNVQGNLNYNQAFNINTNQAANISKVSLIRVGGVTHSVNMDQLHVSLSFRKGQNRLTATPPANSKVAPPGYYMLFILNNQGTPSVARILKLD